ncbi:SpoIIE family protein phosphatase [Bianquea renquensis]|jgi:protein phosphatase prpC|uniref:SpoIIE family protein phosphatase n=1 Tax=Bianquea renquensis TaxID=2763661 RepID=A0A926HZM0_9FIRM|nr:SpoIIE family protein phosphatase [Bianquea renquensis]MBC8542269.1 SpoIIE family protein phosphatase [Bianquea renquensis]
MDNELKISAFALSVTGDGQNLDNVYVNGRYMTAGTEPRTSINKVSHVDFQVYGVCDGQAEVAEDQDQAASPAMVVMQRLQRLQSVLAEEGKIEKDRIWQFMVDTNDKMVEYRNSFESDEVGSTFAALFLHGNRGLAVHLGDSRIYVIRGGRMLQITEDHLESSDLYKMGIISQQQAEIHKRASHLTAYFGMDDLYDVEDDVFSKYFVFYPGDTFIICTDGITDAISNEAMERIVRSLKDGARDTLAARILQEVEDRSQDDRTILVLEVEDAPGEAPVRGASTIPRTENYKHSPQPQEKEEVLRATEEEPSRPVKRRKDPEMPPVEETYDGEDDYEDDEEESVMDRILGNPKMLAAVLGGALIIVLILVVILTLAKRGDKPDSGSTPPPSQSSSQAVDSDATDSSAPEQDSSDESTAMSSPEDSGESSTESSQAPSDSSDSTPSDSVTEYTVQSGDSFSAIINRHYNVNYDEKLMKAVAEYNNIEDMNKLQLGQIIKLPPREQLNLE